MKISLLQLIALCVIFFFVGTISESLYQQGYIPHNKDVTFVWNDDEESIPVDGSLIRIEFTEDGVIYIGPKDQ